MKILFLSRWWPDPPNNGSRLRIYNLLRQLSRQHEVTLVAFHESTDQVGPESQAALLSICRSVRAIPWRPYRPHSARAVLGLLSPIPRFLVDTHSRELADAVADELRTQQYQLVIASELPMAPYALATHGVPLLLEELEITIFRDAASAAGSGLRRLRARLTWLKLQAYLRRVLPRFAACTVVSELERRNVQAVAPGYGPLEVIPNAVDVPAYVNDYGPSEPNTLVFPGALTYQANYDALLYFLESAFPTIARAIPDVRLRVTGNTSGVDLASLPKHPGVVFTGHVPDIRPVVARSWATVVPLRIGGGTRLKILESMALGTPVVSTAKGAEGLEVAPGDDILLADTPAQFAAAVVELLGSPELRARVAAAGRRLVKSRYDWAAVGERLCALVARSATE